MMKPNTSAADYHAEGYCLFRDILDPGEVQDCLLYTSDAADE